MRLGMVVDLEKCIGCGACVVACSEANGVQSNLWRRVFDCGTSGPPERRRMCIPIGCMHCGKPPCLDVCPTGATYKRDDGIVDIKRERCIGCGYCIVACPFMARSIIHNHLNGEGPGDARGGSSRDQETDFVGVCSKCDFCRKRVESGMSAGLRPGADAGASPACVNICAARALSFGDLDDPDSNVSRLIRERTYILLQEELQTEPSMYYLIG